MNSHLAFVFLTILTRLERDEAMRSLKFIFAVVLLGGFASSAHAVGSDAEKEKGPRRPLAKRVRLAPTTGQTPPPSSLFLPLPRADGTCSGCAAPSTPVGQGAPEMPAAPAFEAVTPPPGERTPPPAPATPPRRPYASAPSAPVKPFRVNCTGLEIHEVRGGEMQLGEGEFGQVIRYQWNETEMAVKRFPQVRNREFVRKAMERQERAAATGASPRVLTPLFCLGDPKDPKNPLPRYAYGMELVENAVTAKVYSQRIQDAPDRGARILEVLVHTLQALNAIHAVDLVHQDASSDNVMVIYDAEFRVLGVKLIDLGIDEDGEINSNYALAERFRLPGYVQDWAAVMISYLRGMDHDLGPVPTLARVQTVFAEVTAAVTDLEVVDLKAKLAEFQRQRESAAGAAATTAAGAASAVGADGSPHSGGEDGDLL